MNAAICQQPPRGRQTGLSMIELMVSITISLIVLSGVINVMIVSKSNFVSQREMASLQENARFALKYITDEVRQAGFTGCIMPSFFADAIKGSTTNSTGTWYLDAPGLRGYDDSGAASFPTEFRTSARANTDAIVVRRGEATGLRVTGDASPTLTLNAAHSYKPGQPILVVNPDCEQIGLFQISSPANASNTATTMVHNTGTASPGNGSTNLKYTFTYSAGGTVSGGTPSPSASSYAATSTILALHSEAYYVGDSESDSTVPALFRERMTLNTSTSTPYTLEEELVQGVENMQILYGIDVWNSSTNTAGPDGLADAYVKASSITNTGYLLWTNVVSVRVSLRMRSVNTVYANSTAFPVFEGVTGTDGSDRYMRQTVSSTIMIRNFKI